MDTLTHQVCTVSCRSATLSPLAFPGESNPNFPRGKSQWKNTAAIIIIIIVMIITRHERSVSRSVSSTCMSTQVLRPTTLTEELLQPMVWASSLALWETLPREAPSEKSVSRLETTNKPGQTWQRPCMDTWHANKLCSLLGNSADCVSDISFPST